jgi:hypothetical protein
MSLCVMCCVSSYLFSKPHHTYSTQVACSRGKAVKALRKHGNIVDAILELNP